MVWGGVISVLVLAVSSVTIYCLAISPRQVGGEIRGNFFLELGNCTVGRFFGRDDRTCPALFQATSRVEGSQTSYMTENREKLWLRVRSDTDLSLLHSGARLIVLSAEAFSKHPDRVLAQSFHGAEESSADPMRRGYLRLVANTFSESPTAISRAHRILGLSTRKT